MNATTLLQCENALPEAVRELFGSDQRIQAVGITGDTAEGKYWFRAIKNTALILPQATNNTATQPVGSVAKIPVEFVNVAGEIVSQTLQTQRRSEATEPERNVRQPLYCGLQIQNFDDDIRQRASGVLQPTNFFCGTLGCFVMCGPGNNYPGLLSCNHVIAGEDRGIASTDRILQPGGLVFSDLEHAALLTKSVSLVASPSHARPKLGNVSFNLVDAAVAQLRQEKSYHQAYIPERNLPKPAGTETPKIGMKVFKVGRTTGLTYGTVKDVGVTLGPVPYTVGSCWFNQQFTVESDDGKPFSDGGDSGSIIVNRDNNKIIGLLFAGNGVQTFANPIEEVLHQLACRLVDE